MEQIEELKMPSSFVRQRKNDISSSDEDDYFEEQDAVEELKGGSLKTSCIDFISSLHGR